MWVIRGFFKAIDTYIMNSVLCAHHPKNNGEIHFQLKSSKVKYNWQMLLKF